jgi:SOS-response transcriptional repressor LexA
MQTEDRTDGASSATHLRLVHEETKPATLYYTEFHGSYMRACAGILPGSRLLMAYATEDRPPRDGEVVWFDWGRFGQGCECIDLGVVKWESADAFTFTHDSYGHPSSVNDTGGKWNYHDDDPKQKEYVMRVVAVEHEGVTRWTDEEAREKYAGVKPRRLPKRDERERSIEVKHACECEDFSDKARERTRQAVADIARKLGLTGATPEEVYIEALHRKASVRAVNAAVEAAQRELDIYNQPPLVKRAGRGAITLKAEHDSATGFDIRAGDTLVLDPFRVPQHGDLVAVWQSRRESWVTVGRFRSRYGDERTKKESGVFYVDNYASRGWSGHLRSSEIHFCVASIVRVGAKQPTRKTSTTVERMKWPAEIPG